MIFLAEVAAESTAGVGATVANNFQIAVLAFKSGGWIVSLIGAAAMVGRLLVDESAKASWQRSLRHVLAAAIFSVIAYFVTFQWQLSALNKAIVQGLVGAVAPELVDWLATSIRNTLGFKQEKRMPAWKKLFMKEKKPIRRRKRRATQASALPAKAGKAGKPAQPTKKLGTIKPAVAKPKTRPVKKSDEGQASLNL